MRRRFGANQMPQRGNELEKTKRDSQYELTTTETDTFHRGDGALVTDCAVGRNENGSNLIARFATECTVVIRTSCLPVIKGHVYSCP
jgi:hypothetical protein